MDKCKICGADASIDDSQNCFGKIVICSECGEYVIENSADEDFKTKKFRSCLYYYFRN